MKEKREEEKDQRRKERGRERGIKVVMVEGWKHTIGWCSKHKHSILAPGCSLDFPELSKYILFHYQS